MFQNSDNFPCPLSQSLAVMVTSFYPRDYKLSAYSGATQVPDGVRKDQVNWEAHILARRSQARSMGPEGLDDVLFQEKQEMDFYIKRSRFFNICNLFNFPPPNPSVGLMWPLGYQFAVLSDTLSSSYFHNPSQKWPRHPVVWSHDRLGE